MDVVGKNSKFEFVSLISKIAVGVQSRRLRKVLVEISCRTRNFHTQNCDTKSVFEFCKIFQFLLSDVFAIFD